MITNRSVPANVMLAHVVYENVEEAIAWLTRVFGFEEHYRYGAPGAAAGAQLCLGEAWIMASAARPGRMTPTKAGGWTQGLTIFVEDVDQHYARAKAEGATIFEELHETEYGERQYGAEDLARHRWLFSRHARNANPSDWGAALANPLKAATQIAPMLAVNDGNAAIAFYQAAFGASLLWHLGDDHVVAGMEVAGAKFFLANESPSFGTKGPLLAGCTTVRIELFVDDPAAMQQRAVAAGAREKDPLQEHTHETIGREPIRKMLQGAVIDPFGHLWLIGKFLE